MKRRTAFTLIELLAASALAAVLMVVLFQVIGSLGRTRAAMAVAEARPSAAPAAWQAALLDALRRDLANATDVRLGPGRLEITGHGALDRHTLAATHEPVTVVYELAGRTPGRAHLVRQQSPRGSSGAGRAWSELLCVDAAEFTVAPVSGAAHPLVRADPLATPLRVVVRTAGANVLLDEVIVTR